jgi:hypothetical protein
MKKLRWTQALDLPLLVAADSLESACESATLAEVALSDTALGSFTNLCQTTSPAAAMGLDGAASLTDLSWGI